MCVVVVVVIAAVVVSVVVVAPSCVVVVAFVTRLSKQAFSCLGFKRVSFFFCFFVSAFGPQFLFSFSFLFFGILSSPLFFSAHQGCPLL